MVQGVKTEDLRADKLFSVKDYVCLVTGGGSGIGLMASQVLAANGARVYITSRTMDKLEQAAKAHSPRDGKGAIIPIGPCDVTSKDDLQKLCDDLSKREKHLDLLVANAGVSGPKGNPDTSNAQELKAKLWESESVEEWNEVHNTNVTSVYFTTVAFLPLLQAATKARGHLSASVIVISSMSGIMRDAQGHFSYNASKGATIHLSTLMSGEFQKTGVRVNSIAPGYFPSEMTTNESDENQKSYMPDEKVQEKGHVPAQRPGHDEEMYGSSVTQPTHKAQVVIMLAKNSYVNGEVIAVDGGVLNTVPGR